MPKYHLDICCVKGRPRNWGLEIWSSQVGRGEYVCVCVCVCVCGTVEHCNKNRDIDPYKTHADVDLCVSCLELGYLSLIKHSLCQK